nr:unnamed protein product [Callosobruchus analis]
MIFRIVFQYYKKTLRNCANILRITIWT